MLWTPLRFGKYEELPLPEVVLRDPNWFFWAYEKRSFGGGDLAREAGWVQRQARHIRLPLKAPELHEVEYLFDPYGKLRHVTVVHAQRNRPADPSSIFRKDIDLSIPHDIGKQDRYGGQVIMEFLKRFVFCDEGITLTTEICEEFFDDDENFDLGQTPSAPTKPKGLLFLNPI